MGGSAANYNNCNDPTAVGYQAAVRANGGVALGWQATVQDASSYGSALGARTKVSAVYGVAVGYYALADRPGQLAHAAAYLNTQGDVQSSEFVLSANTSGATPVIATSAGSSIAIPASHSGKFRIQVVARRTDAAGECAGWELSGLISRDASGACRAVGTWTGAGTPLYSDAAASGWSVALAANTSTNELVLTVTGGAGKTVVWAAVVQLAEARG